MDCSHIPQTTYRQFSVPLHDKAARGKIPLVGEMSLTYDCNLSCQHCYCPRAAREKEMTSGQIRRILDEMAAAGCLWLLFTGGEPFTRLDFLDIYAHAKKRGFIITIFTNGTLITSEIADYLEEWPPFLVEISLYGATQETYEKVTGVAGSYRKCLRGIELLLERKIPLKLKTLVTILNRHELPLMQEFSRSRGLDFRFDSLINPRLDGCLLPYEQRISLEEAVELELSDAARRRFWQRLYREIESVPKKIDRLYTCVVGTWSFHINASGRLQLCLIAQEPSFDLGRAPFLQSWKRLLAAFEKIRPDEKNKCISCRLRHLCAPCPSWAKLENGDANATIDYTCKMAHALVEGLKGLKGGGKNEVKRKKILQEAPSAGSRA